VVWVTICGLTRASVRLEPHYRNVAESIVMLVARGMGGVGGCSKWVQLLLAAKGMGLPYSK
jgi:hypothetical protein